MCIKSPNSLDYVKKINNLAEPTLNSIPPANFQQKFILRKTRISINYLERVVKYRSYF